MAEVGFYHLQGMALEAALPKLLEKVLASDGRAVVMAGSEERAEALNTALWLYHPNSFLPHGSARDGHAPHQPVWITVEDENPNGANFLVLTDGAVSANMDGFERCLEIFDGNDADAVSAARARWREYGEKGFEVRYWQQTETGGWEQKA